MPRFPTSSPRADGALAGVVRRGAGVAIRHPRRTIALWLLLVVACLAAGAATGTRQLSPLDSGTGESQRADRATRAAGLERPASESILVRSRDAAATRAAVAELERRLASLPTVRRVTGPEQSPALARDAGRTALVQAELRGAAEQAAAHAAPVERAVAAARLRPGVRLDEVGAGSAQRAFDRVLGHDLRRAELSSIPLTLAILAIAFGALVAAAVPLLLAVTAVAAALGALGVVSQVTPVDPATTTVVVLIGLAVGVDYSLFYIRREREERRRGRSQDAALDLAAATVGRAVFISGLTVMVALAGLFVSGLAVFQSMALATMLVALIAVIASLTVLPAVLTLLGGRVDRGRIAGLARLRARRAGRAGAWARVAEAVTARPAAALIVAICLLGSLAVPALGLRTATAGVSDLPRDEPVAVAMRAVERTFPGAPEGAQLVVAGARLESPAARARLAALGSRARALTGGRGALDVAVARDGRTAVVSVPMPDRGADESRAIVRRLREQVARPAGALVSGRAAGDADWTAQLQTATPLVIGFVLALAFGLLLAAFRAPALAAAVIGLNVLSIGATYGLLAAVFQHRWAEGLLGFTSTGAITAWLPLFAFVILFGLSMDYTILVLERIREARRAGAGARQAAAAGVSATAGAVTSAAVIMVAVFGVFATLRLVQFKQFGVGLAAAILLDATIVRGIALPAAVALLGERRWRVRPVRERRREPALAGAAR